MAWLLAFVADAVLLAGALARQVADLSAVIALLSLGAVARQVSVAAARVAGLLAAATTTEAAWGWGSVATAAAIGGALTGDVANLAALVALGTTTLSAAVSVSAGSSSLDAGVGAVTREVTRLVALVAGLLLLRTGAFTAHVSVLSAVVAHRSSALGAVTSLMSRLAAVVAGTTACGTTTVSTTLVVHCVDS